jgi:hypothetical protein
MFKIMLALLALVCFGCAQDNAITANTDRDLFIGKPAAVAPEANKKIFLTEESLPDGVKYQELGEIKIIRMGSVGFPAIYQAIANKALDVGADAVIKIGVWRQPTNRTFGSEQGAGVAVKFEDVSKVDLAGMKGQWLGRGFALKSKAPAGGGDELK